MSLMLRVNKYKHFHIDLNVGQLLQFYMLRFYIPVCGLRGLR